MIKTVNLQKIFKTEEVETWALNNVNLEIKAGEFVAIMGPSGCGKSTLLNILGLLDNPTEGTYELNGTDVSKFTEAQRTNLRKGVIGFVFQSFNLIDELNVFENIELPLLYMGIPAAERKRRVEDAMNRMAIAHRVKHFPQQLSGGQQQRVAIARAGLRHVALHLLALCRFLVAERTLTVSARTRRGTEQCLHLLHVQYRFQFLVIVLSDVQLLLLHIKTLLDALFNIRIGHGSTLLSVGRTIGRIRTIFHAFLKFGQIFLIDRSELCSSCIIEHQALGHAVGSHFNGLLG